MAGNKVFIVGDKIMILRRLEKKDAPYMLEWMHDEDSVRYLKNDFMEMTLDECERFIDRSSIEYVHNGTIDFAVIDEGDEYMGTISLKNIDMNAGNAEYAISMRTCARGSGLALKATNELLRRAFEEWEMERVYLNVIDENKRAIRFYEKAGFSYEGTFRKHLRIKGELVDLKWYSMLKSDFL